jgi:hypothetical protein
MRQVFCWLALLATVRLHADTIFQITAQGKQAVVQRDAIVVREDSSSLIYKHFELRERRVTKVRLNKGSLPYSVEASSPEGQKRIVETWKRFGNSASVTDQAGKTTRVFDAYLDFYPPGGHGSLLESILPRTAFDLLLDGGGANEIEFHKISRVELQGDRLKVTLREGTAEEGRFLMPTNQPAEARFLGITDNYSPSSEEVFDFSLPLAKIKEIRFE